MAFITPDLSYDYNALEPSIDEQTMRVHHDKHHVGYTTKLNAAVEGTEYANWAIEKLLGGLSSLPAKIATAVRNNGGGHYNHSLFWKGMKPGGGGEPTGDLYRAIQRDIGVLNAFTEQFSQAAIGRFGSGWAWLVVSGGRLSIVSTANQDNPLSDGKQPILGLDVWEHAYYLKYQNRRPEYVANFFNVIDWEEVAANYAAAR